MPLTKTGKSVLNAMIKRHGTVAGTKTFYTSINKKVPNSQTWHDKKDSNAKSRFTEALA